jgi:hypothetical protein
MKRFQYVKRVLRGGLGFSVRKGLVLILALTVLSGASVWEGAAALAPRGELPEDGYYAATNSFPQNTVVDITNLETGKSVRAIVSSGLNTPGLLAIISADTASRIGLSAKTIGRIRMTQPEDPIAFSRFTEGLVVSGDPDYDPEAMLAGDAREQEELERGIPRPSPEKPAETSQKKDAPAYGYEIPKGIEYSDYADYSHGSIVDVRGDSAPAPRPETQAADEWEDDWDDRAYSGYPAGDGESVEKTNYPVWEQGGSVGRLSPAPSVSPSAPQPPADPWEEAWRESGASRTQGDDQGRFMAEAAATANAEENESRASARILVQPPPGTVEYTLIPAEERPPAAPPSTEPVPPVRPPAQGATEALDKSLFIDPIEKQREARAAEEARLAEAARAEEARKAAEAARAEEARKAAEAARAEEARKAAEAARAAEEARLAEAARAVPPEVVVKEPEEAGEPKGPWVEPIAAAPVPKAVPPEVVVKEPEESGEPGGPWVEPIAAVPAPKAVPPEVVVKEPEESGEPKGPWVEPIAAAPAPQTVPPEVVVKEPEEAGEPKGPWVEPEAPPRRTGGESGEPGIFSVPVNIIGELEKGKYYVQLGAYRSAASVESALLKLDPGYPLNVQNAGTGDSPMYRLLVGPLNLGESGALVQRFKGSGYRDAYVRTN